MSYDIWELRERLEQSEAKNAKLRVELYDLRNTTLRTLHDGCNRQLEEITALRALLAEARSSATHVRVMSDGLCKRIDAALRDNPNAYTNEPLTWTASGWQPLREGK